MVIWHGRGIVALLLLIIGGLAGTGIGVALGGSSSHANLGTVIGLLLSAIPIWLLGVAWNKPVEGFDPSSGQPRAYRNQHRLFWLPMQYWAVVAVGLAILALVLYLSA